MSKVAYPLRIDEKDMNKIKYLAETESRSVNKQIEYVIKTFLSEYESKNGVIPQLEE